MQRKLSKVVFKKSSKVVDQHGKEKNQIPLKSYHLLMIEVHNVVLCLYFNENVAQANLHKTGDFIYNYYW